MSPLIKKKYSKFWNCFGASNVQYIVSVNAHPTESVIVNLITGAVLKIDGKV